VQRGIQRPRQHHHPVFATLAVTHHQHVPIKVHIFHPQAQPFVEAHTRAIQQLGQQQFNPGHYTQQGRHLGNGQYRWNTPWPSRALHFVKPWQLHTQNLAVQKQQGTERLVVGGH
jgi:hypothetical protein